MISFAIQAETNKLSQVSSSGVGQKPNCTVVSGKELTTPTNKWHRVPISPTLRAQDNRTHTFWSLSLLANTLFSVLLHSFVP